MGQVKIQLRGPNIDNERWITARTEKKWWDGHVNMMTLSAKTSLMLKVHKAGFRREGQID